MKYEYIIKFQQQTMKVVNLKHLALKNSENERSQSLNPLLPAPENIKSTKNNDIIKVPSNKISKQNEDLIWLEKLVHEFQTYNDVKDPLFKDEKQCPFETENRLAEPKQSCQNPFIKIVIAENSNRLNQLSQNSQFAKKNIFSRSKEIKHEVTQRNIPQTKVSIGNLKKKRSQSQGFSFLKKKQRTAQEPVCTKKNQKFIEGTKDQKRLIVQTQRKLTIQAFSKKGLDITQLLEPSDLRTDLQTMKAKLSMAETKKSGKKEGKIVMVKQNRKNIWLQNKQKSDKKQKFGRIVKNKSVQMKQRLHEYKSEEKENKKNEIEQLLQKEQERKQKKKLEGNRNQNYSQMHRYNSKQKRQASIQREKQETNQFIFTKGECINNKPDRIFQSFPLKQDQPQERNINIINIRAKNQSKKYDYLLDKNFDLSIDKNSCKKQQRKLNCSNGDRTKTHFKIEYSENKTQENRILKKQSQSVANLQMDTKTEPLSKNCNSNNFCNQIKIVESTLNSQVFTEQSVVIEKNIIESHQTSQILNRKKGSEIREEWNILQIFERLDRKKMGILSQQNCGIQYVSRQIRYILGTVLEQILYRNVKYNFVQFVNRVEKNLQNIKETCFPTYEFQQYLKLKEWAPQTKRIAEQLKSGQINKAKQCSHIKGNIRKNQQTTIGAITIHNIETQPTHSTLEDTRKLQFKIKGKEKEREDSKHIRFATFQDEQHVKDEDRQQKLRKEEKDEKPNWKQIEVKQNILQQVPNNGNKIYSSRNIDNKVISSNSIRQMRCRTAQKENQKFKHQIIKLEILNERLQKYLNDQSMKEFSTSKLLIQDL